jgi:hypothetical protein
MKINRIIVHRCLFFLILWFSCSPDDSVYNPCLTHLRIDNPRPSQHSLNWMPAFGGPQLIYQTLSGKEITLEPSTEQFYRESLHSNFNISCPQDTSQISKVDYTSLEYQNVYYVSSPIGQLAAIQISLDVLVDELNSDLDDIKLVDFLKIDFIIRLSSSTTKSVRVLQFPVLDRGYIQSFPYDYKLHNSIQLNNINYRNVFSNYEINEQILVYYNDSGLIGFEFDGEIYTKQ